MTQNHVETNCISMILRMGLATVWIGVQLLLVGGIVAAAVGPINNVTLGIMLPWTGSWPVGKLLASATLIAIDDINARSDLLINHTVGFSWMDCKCNAKYGVGTTSVLIDQDVDVLIGPYCSDGCIPAASLAAFFNKPMIGYSCSASELSDKRVYPTFARTESFARTDPVQVTANFVQLIKFFNWRLCALIVAVADAWRLLGEYMHDNLEDFDIDVAEYISFSQSSDDFDDLMERATRRARIIVILGYSLETAKFLSAAHQHGKMDGNHVFITFDFKIESSWKNESWMFGRNMSTVFDGFLDMSVASPFSTGRSYSNFSAEVRRRMPEMPFNHTMKDTEVVNPSAAYLYDAILLYACALNESLAAGHDARDTEALMQLIFNMTFEGKSGSVGIDLKGDRLPIHELYNYNYGDPVILMSYNSATSELIIFNNDTFRWPANAVHPPKDRPDCGFYNELCNVKAPVKSHHDAKLYGSVITGIMVVLIIALIAFIIKYRRHKFENDLLAESFFVSFEDVTSNLAKGNFGKGALARLMSRAYSICADTESAMERNRHVGRYMGSQVYIKEINRPTVNITRDHLLEFKKVRDLRHSNLNSVVGVCTQAPHVCILWSYGQKGSLQDVLRNEDINLDKMFKMSFMVDMVDGMSELHRSEIGPHGHFSSSNCIIDNRWVLKITDFGFEKLRSDRKYSIVTGIQRNLKTLYTSPEHIIDGCTTLPGDVYSFGIVMSEICTRKEPYSEYDLSPDEIISRIAQRFKPALRPMEYESLCDKQLVSLARMCWDDAPHARPNFDMISLTLRNYHGERKGNLIENMIELMEKYTDNLEELVQKRTDQLALEKEKTEELLYKMIPRSIAEQLKSGSAVTAESFDSVSIYFSDIVGFTSLASNSTPMQVVALLNDLYTAFDAVVDAYDAYKVETIGDAYMVASGLPQRNGIKHAGEIATMCLDLLHVVKNFTIRHIPDRQLQLRIGIHTGPCVAGVVGVKMPRYCLFGDTVNYASRMESTGLALRVHVSPECKEALDLLGGYHLVERGPVTMKGKGTITTYFLEGKVGYKLSLPDLNLSAPLAEHEFK